MLTAERARELLDYNPETGVVRWRAPSAPQSQITVGAEAGCVNRAIGYRYISINDRRYLTHRLAFLIMVGRWPHDEIDHINGVKDDNRWSNLRETGRVGNNRNRCLSSNNTSGHMGVHWDQSRGKWCAQINGKHLGRFKNLADAAAARKAADVEYGYHANHGRAV